MTERGHSPSGVTGLAHFCLQDHLLFSQGESVDQVEEGHRRHQGDVALLVHTMFIQYHDAEGIEWNSQQQPELQGQGWRHHLCSYPADEGWEHPYQLHHSDVSKIQATLCLLEHPQLQPVEEVSGCGGGHNEQSPFLIKLIQKCSCCSHADIDIHGCAGGLSARPSQVGLTYSGRAPLELVASDAGEFTHSPIIIAVTGALHVAVLWGMELAAASHSYFNSKLASALVLGSVIDCVLDLVVSFWKMRAWGWAF